jgi:hypothetical protein
VLLVHDDQAERWQRREHRRARADHHVERAAPRQLPVAPPLAHREVRMQHADRAPNRRRNSRTSCEPSATSGTSTSVCRRRRARGRRAQVDLGLAAGGDAVEQQRRESAAPQDVSIARAHRAGRASA